MLTGVRLRGTRTSAVGVDDLGIARRLGRDRKTVWVQLAGWQASTLGRARRSGVARAAATWRAGGRPASEIQRSGWACRSPAEG